MDFSLPQIEVSSVGAPPVTLVRDVEPRAPRRTDTALVELLQTLAALLQADAIELTWRKGRTASPAIFANWPTSHLSQIAEDGEKPTHMCRQSIDTGSQRHWELWIRRQTGSAPFTPQERALAVAAAELFCAGFKLWRKADLKARRLEAIERLVGTLNYGIILVNDRGRVAFSNQKAQEVLNCGAGLASRSGRLVAAGFANTVRLQSAVHYAMQSATPVERIDANAVFAIDRKNAAPLVVAAFRVSGASAHHQVGILILDPASDLAGATSIACRTLGLTPTEMRLVRHLANGSSVADACKAMQIKPQTGRTYLKQVFSKFGVGRQVDLVRYILSCALPLRFTSSPASV